MTHIDTAEMYGDAEAVVAEAIAGRRDEVFLVSKVLPEHATRKGTIPACERSLRRLRTDRLDSYLLHWAGEHPLEDTIAAFEELRQAGKILLVGRQQLRRPRARGGARDRRRGPDRVQPGPLSPEQRAIEHAVLPWCEKHGVAVVGYTPFGQRRFPGPRSKGGRVLHEIAAAHGATPRQVALRFLVRRAPLFAIPKAGEAGARRRERRRREPPAHRGRDRPDRARVPARAASPRAPDALEPRSRSRAGSGG